MAINLDNVVWDEQPQTTQPSTIDLSKVVWDEPQPPQEEKSMGRKVIDGLAYVGRVFTGQEQEKTLNELSQKVQSDINAAPEGIQKEIAQGVHNSTEGMQLIENQPWTALTEGRDAAKEQNLKEKALDLIAKADSLDETSLYSSQIKQLWNTIGDKVPTKEEAQKLQELQTERLRGYDKLFEKAGIGEFGIDTNTGEKYLIVGDKHVPLDNSLIDEIQAGLKANSSVAIGAMSGAYQGAKVSKNPIGALIGGAVGAFGGSLTDTALNASATDTDINAKLALRKASEEAVFDPIMTLLTAGTIHVAGKPFALAADKAKDLANTLKHYVVDANLDGASNILKQQGYTQEAIDAINAGVAKFQSVPQDIKGPRDNIITKTLGKGEDLFNKYVKEGTAETQNSFVNVAQQDGTLMEQVTDVLKTYPSLSKQVGQDVSARSVSIEKALEDRSINPWDMRAKMEAYEQGVKMEYAQTKELIQESIPEAKFSLKNTNIPQTINDLEKSIGDTNVKNELLALSHRIAKKEEMSASEFIDVREDINRILRKGSVQSYADKEALNGIKQTLDESLNTALKDAPIDASAIKTQFENSVTNYRSMKELQDTNLYAGIMGDELSLKNVTSALSKGAKTEDGTLDRMLSKLSPADRESVEHSVVLDLYRKNQEEFANDFKATDFETLEKDLSKIALKNIKSESVRKTINDLKEMSRYFKNDVTIMSATTKSKAKKPSQGISPDPRARLKTRIGNMAADFLLRYSPTSIFFGAANEPAFRYHLKQSLKRSRSPIEFISEIIKHPDLPPSLLQNLQGALKEYQKEMMRVAQTPKEVKEFQSAQVLMDKMDKRVEKITVNERAATFTTPSSEELKVVDSHADLNTQKVIIAIKEGKATDYQKVKYLDAKAAIGQEKIDKEVASIQANAQALKEKEQTLLSNPRLEELLSMREKVTANDAKYAQRQISSSGVTESGDFYKSGNTRNYNADFELFGSDVKRIREGRLNEAILTKLENDLGRLENDPLYIKNPQSSGVEKTTVKQAENILERLKSEIDYKTLSPEEQTIFDTYVGTKTVAEIKIADLNDVISLEYGSKRTGAKKILVKHGGEEKTGGLTPSELLKMGEVIRYGEIAENSFSETEHSIRYAYDYQKHDINYRVLVEEFNDGKKVINYYSDRNFVDYKKGVARDTSPTSTTPSTNESISQDALKNQIFSRGALTSAGALNGVTMEEDGTMSFNSVDALKGMAISAGLELFGSRLLKGDSIMRRGSIGIRPDTKAVELYAKAGKLIAEKMPNKMDALALEAMLKKAGVKDDEIVWSGLKALKGRVSKEEVEAILGAHKLELNEIIKTDPQTQRYLAYTEPGGTNYKEYLLTLPNLPSYSSKHWNENNIVAFMRTKDRAIENKNSLFIEEIQSDWHQEGRKKGYEGSIPEAPFKTTWPELAVKRLIKEAVDNGYEQIAWTTGASQAKRYSLTKSLKEIDYKLNGDGTYTLDITHKDGARDKRAYILPIDMQDHIGKELAERVLKNEGNGVLNSTNLQIDNKGMNTFYDTIIPTAIKKWLKVQPQKVKVGDQEVWRAAIKQNRAEEIQKSGLPLYATVGGTFSIGAGGSDGVQ